MRRLAAVLLLLTACGGPSQDCDASAACEMVDATVARCWWKDTAHEAAATLDGKTPCLRIVGSEARIEHPLCGSGGTVNSVRYDCH